MPEPRADCPSCGARVPDEARFCPQCGERVREGDTVRAKLPPHETGPVPVHVQEATPRWFGIAPPTLVLVLAGAALVLALVLLLTANWVAGLLVLGLGLLLAAAFLEVARRKPDGALVKHAAEAVDSFGARAGFTAQALRTRSSARREIGRRRAELFRLASERERALRALGEAVYRGEDGSAARALLEELDKRAARLEAEAAEIAAQARERVERGALAVQPTEVVRPDDE